MDLQFHIAKEGEHKHANVDTHITHSRWSWGGQPSSSKCEMCQRWSAADPQARRHGHAFDKNSDVEGKTEGERHGERSKEFGNAYSIVYLQFPPWEAISRGKGIVLYENKQQNQ